MKNFCWNPKRELAAVMLAQGEKRDVIARACGVERQTVHLWSQVPEFAARVKEIKVVVRKQSLDQGFAKSVGRLRRYEQRLDQIEQLVQERAADPTHADVPGWRTGLLYHEQKSIGAGDRARIVDVYKVDVGTIKEERDLTKQVTQELLSLLQKNETGLDLSGLSDDELEALERIRAKLGG